MWREAVDSNAQTGESAKTLDRLCRVEDWAQAPSALRAQPPAREDAQPVAKVVSAYGDPEAFGEREIKVLQDLSRIPYNTPLYTHPAPDALRVAVEALEAEKEWHERVADFAFDEARECSERGEESYETTAMTKANAHTERAAIITKVLAALQAEQKGGA
jgi:hypothetical protein